MPTKCLTGVGRIVWGNPTKAQIKKYQEGPDKGKPVLKDGKPVEQWAFGVAFPKAEFQQMIWPAMSAEASSGFPQGFPPKFAWKYQDGDGVDSDGKPFNTREGYAGCYVLTVSTTAFAPNVFKFVPQQGVYIAVQPNEIKTGDYVVLALNFQVNVPTDRTRVPSIYVNPEGVELVGYGTAIVNANADPMKLFGGQQRQLPPGASTVPVASSGNVAMPGTGPQMQPGGIPGMPGGAPQMQPGAPTGYPQASPGYSPPPNPAFTGGTPQYQQPQPGMMQPQYQQPQVQIAPAHDFVQNAGQQQMPQGQPQYQPQPGQHQMPGMQPGMMPPNR